MPQDFISDEELGSVESKTSAAPADFISDADAGLPPPPSAFQQGARFLGAAANYGAHRIGEKAELASQALGGVYDVAKGGVNAAMDVADQFRGNSSAGGGYLHGIASLPRMAQKYVGDPARAEYQKYLEAPTGSEAIGHATAAALPMIGPAAAHAGEEIGSGDPRRAARGTGQAMAMVAGPRLMEAAGGAIPGVAEALPGAARAVGNTTIDAARNLAGRAKAGVNAVDMTPATFEAAHMLHPGTGIPAYLGRRAWQFAKGALKGPPKAAAELPRPPVSTTGMPEPPQMSPAYGQYRRPMEAPTAPSEAPRALPKPPAQRLAPPPDKPPIDVDAANDAFMDASRAEAEASGMGNGTELETPGSTSSGTMIRPDGSSARFRGAWDKTVPDGAPDPNLMAVLEESLKRAKKKGKPKGAPPKKVSVKPKPTSST
jgi:hypothetical protein